MRKERNDGMKTRERLLETAGKLFARTGYRDTTVAAICHAAGANVASVNYYFGTKENLYIESWKHYLERSLRSHPPDGGVASDASPEARLYGRIRSLVGRVMDQESYNLDIMQMEITQPTGLLGKVKKSALDPIRDGLTGVIRELLGPTVGEESVAYCRISIMAQCIGHLMRERQRKRSGHGNITDIEGYAEHVFRFSLAGIREIRDNLNAENEVK